MSDPGCSAASKPGDPTTDEQAVMAARGKTGAESPRTTPVGSPDSTAAIRRDEERLLNLWVTMPNYVRIVYGYVPPWHWSRRV